jgi:hypothetical protein
MTLGSRPTSAHGTQILLPVSITAYRGFHSSQVEWGIFPSTTVSPGRFRSWDVAHPPMAIERVESCVYQLHIGHLASTWASTTTPTRPCGQSRKGGHPPERSRPLWYLSKSLVRLSLVNRRLRPWQPGFLYQPLLESTGRDSRKRGLQAPASIDADDHGLASCPDDPPWLRIHGFASTQKTHASGPPAGSLAKKYCVPFQSPPFWSSAPFLEFELILALH